MDWGRAKNIILAVLVVTNIFLISVYGIKYERSKENNSELYRYTIQQLEKNHIELECEIPSNPGKLPALTVQYEKYDSRQINKQIEAAGKAEKRAEEEEEYRREADAFIEKCGLDSQGAVILQTEKNEDGSTVVRYENRYRGIPLQECYMNVVFRGGKVAGLERKWMEPVEESRAKLEITEPVTALLRFIDLVNGERAENAGTQQETGTAESSEEDDVEPVTVEKMYLSYYVESDEINRNILSDTAFPAWCIEYGDGQIKYISAFAQ